MDETTPHSPAQSTPRGERFRICEVPIVRVLLSSGTNTPDVWNLVRDAWAGTAKAVCGIWLILLSQSNRVIAFA